MTTAETKLTFEALYRWVLSDPRTIPSDVCEDVERLHALAGFTREDVARLRDSPDLYGGLQRTKLERDWYAFLESLANRIAALLPPE